MIDYDVVVAGGGMAGVCSAICAARNGARVCLIEQSAMLGGLGTNGMMTAIISPKTNFGGIGAEIIDELRKRGGISPDVEAGTYHWVPYKNDEMKRLLDELILQSGVDLYLYTKITGVKKKNDLLTALEVSGVEGAFELSGHTYIDATGDAMLSLFAGEAYEVGDENGNTQAPTMTAYYADVDFDMYDAFVQSEGGDVVSVIHKYLPIAVADGVLSELDMHHPGAFKIGDNMAVVNAGHVYGADCVSAKGLTEATIKGRKLAKEYYAFYKKYIPGFQYAVLTNTASTLGIRETRRVIGQYVLNYEDKKNYVKFPDAVVRFEGGNASDLHASSNKKEDYEAYFNLFTDYKDYKQDDFATIPYRSLLTKQTKNLILAGRCISADRVVNAQIRVMGYCMMMGQAAGSAAAMAALSKIAAHEIDITELQGILRKQGIENT